MRRSVALQIELLLKGLAGGPLPPEWSAGCSRRGRTRAWPLHSRHHSRQPMKVDDAGAGT